MRVEEKKRSRYMFLEHLYNTVQGNSGYSVSMWELGAELNIDRENISSIVQYLIDECLVEPRGLGGIIAISHSGILEVEEAVSNPDRPTEHFLPLNIINIHSMNNSAIQQGNYQSSQQVNITKETIDDINEVIALLNDHIENFELSKDDKSELIAEKETLESQTKSPKPKGVIVRESLKTVRALIEGVSSSIIASKVVRMIDALL